MNGHCNDVQRDELIKRVKSGDIEVLWCQESNIRGLDLPFLTHVFICTPSVLADSHLYLHTAGRLSRGTNSDNGGHVVCIIAPDGEDHHLRMLQKEFSLATQSPPSTSSSSPSISSSISMLRFEPYSSSYETLESLKLLTREEAEARGVEIDGRPNKEARRLAHLLRTATPSTSTSSSSSSSSPPPVPSMSKATTITRAEAVTSVSTSSTIDATTPLPSTLTPKVIASVTSVVEHGVTNSPLPTSVNQAHDEVSSPSQSLNISDVTQPTNEMKNYNDDNKISNNDNKDVGGMKDLASINNDGESDIVIQDQRWQSHMMLPDPSDWDDSDNWIEEITEQENNYDGGNDNTINNYQQPKRNEREGQDATSRGHSWKDGLDFTPLNATRRQTRGGRKHAKKGSEKRNEI
jgi:superfamily II DNA/RNA helicase